MACTKNSANTASTADAASTAAAAAADTSTADTAGTAGAMAEVPMRRYVHPISPCCPAASDTACILQLLQQQTDLLLQIRALLLGYPPCCR